MREDDLIHKLFACRKLKRGLTMKYTKLLLILIFLFPFLSSCSSEYKSYDDKTVKYISDDIFRKIKSGNLKEVEGYIDYLVKKKPYSKNGTRLLEEIYWNLSYRRDVLEQYNKWCSSEPLHHAAFILRGSYHKASAWLERGSGYAYTVSDIGRELFERNLELSKDDLEKAYALNPEDPNSASSMIAVCMGLRYQEDEMEKWFQRAVAADPLAYDAYSRKLLFLNPKWRGTKEKHIKFAEYCYQNSPPKSIVYKILFDCLSGYLEKANDINKFYNNPSVKNTLENIYQKILKDFPNSTAIRLDYAGIQYKIGRVGNTIRLVEDVLKLEPDNTGALFTRANYYLNKGDFKSAEPDYKKVIEIAPYNTKVVSEAYFWLGDIKRKQYRDYKKAQEYYDKAIALYPKDENYYITRGFNRVMINYDFKSALVDFNKAIEINPRHVYANHYKAMCLKDLSRCEEAIVFYKKALELIEEETQKGDAGSIKKQAAENLAIKINSDIKYCKSSIIKKKE